MKCKIVRNIIVINVVYCEIEIWIVSGQIVSKLCNQNELLSSYLKNIIFQERYFFYYLQIRNLIKEEITTITTTANSSEKYLLKNTFCIEHCPFFHCKVANRLS